MIEVIRCVQRVYAIAPTQSHRRGLRTAHGDPFIRAPLQSGERVLVVSLQLRL